MVEKPDRIPTRAEALKLFDKYHVPNHIRDHCMAVSVVAKVFASQLKQKGVNIDVELTQIAALFHDFMKAIAIPPMQDDPYFKCFPTEKQKEMQASLKEQFEGMHETQAAFEILKDKWPKVAQLVRSLHDHNPDGTQIFTCDEQKVIAYADLSCFVDEIWPYDNRCNEFLHRKREKYTKNGRLEHVTRNIKHIKQAAQALLEQAGITAEQLIELAKKEQQQTKN